MKIVRWRCEECTNFGDELNLWLWPRLLPGFFDQDESSLFLGIGSILGMFTFPQTARKIVFGSSYVPEYCPILPDLGGANWDIVFVRDARTASLLSLDPALALGDPAILVRLAEPPNPLATHSVAFMPHWSSMYRGRWPEVCEIAGIKLIDPRQDVAQILAEIQGSQQLITEALHGAIVADALRVPWLPVIPLEFNHRAKWAPWARSMDIELRPLPLKSSHWAESGIRGATKVMRRVPCSSLLSDLLVDRAARHLKKLACESPYLSALPVLDRATERILNLLNSVSAR